MEENIQNQPEDITNDYVSPDDIDINLDEDYVINWDAPQNTEEDAIQEREAEEVSLGERAGDSEEVDGSLRIDSDQEEYADEGESEEEGYLDDAVELGSIQEDYNEGDSDEDEYYDEDDEYEDEDDDYDDDYEGDDWDKLFDFLEDHPGATIEDYMSVQQGYDDLTDDQVLKIQLASEHGLDVEEDADELDFLYEDTYGYDEELDSERDIKLKQLAAKKAVREVRAELSELQDKYAANPTFGGGSPELKELQAFQNEQLELQQQTEEAASAFQKNTEDYFSTQFKGFEFSYGDGRSQRIKADPNKTADFQKDISNFIGQYMGDNGQIEDLAGYHKALWAAQNADALFSHAYEQGKADAVRSAARSAKNIDMDPRQSTGGQEQYQSGFKLIDDDSTEDFKINLNNY